MLCQLRRWTWSTFSCDSVKSNMFKPNCMLDFKGRSMGKIAFPKDNSKLRNKSRLKAWNRRSCYTFLYLFPNCFIIHCNYHSVQDRKDKNLLFQNGPSEQICTHLLLWRKVKHQSSYNPFLKVMVFSALLQKQSTTSASAQPTFLDDYMHLEEALTVFWTNKQKKACDTSTWPNMNHGSYLLHLLVFSNPGIGHEEMRVILFTVGDFLYSCLIKFSYKFR